MDDEYKGGKTMKIKSGITHYTRAGIITRIKLWAQRRIDEACFSPQSRDGATVAEMQFLAWIAK